MIRPVYQDFLFPTAVYVGGEGEAKYWTQTLPLYEFFNVTQPLFVPRNQFLVFERKQQKLFDKLDIKISDLSKTSKEFLDERLSDTDLSSEKIFSDFLTSLTSIYKPFEHRLVEVNAGLEKFTKKTRTSIDSSISKLKGKYEQALLEREKTQVNQFETLRAYFYPENLPQDRVISFANYIMRYGTTFIDQIHAEIEVKERFSYTALSLNDK